MSIKKLTYFLVGLLLQSPSFAQNWPQLGSKIIGEAYYKSGHAVSLSSDGLTLAIGTPYPNNNLGQVKIFKNVNGTWNQKGNTLNGSYTTAPQGTKYPERFGYSLSLSNDGNTIAIGAPYYTSYSPWGIRTGRVIVYKSVGSSWVQVGTPIVGEEELDESGYSVSLSGDGSTLAIGARYNEGNLTHPSSEDPGHVRIYKNVNGTWRQIGSDINGERAYDGSGWSVSLSSDGSTVAIGAPYNDDGGSNAGQVRVYKNISGSWTKVGSDIDGDNAEDEMGYSVSISADGSIVAIGAIMSAGTLVWDKGYVRIYQNVSGVWTQVGSDIIGEAQYDQFGYSVSLSADGSRLIASTPWNDDVAGGSGHARIYENINSTWTQLGSDIDGDSSNVRFGFSASLSDDGTTAAVGALYGMPDGSKLQAGEVSVFTECLSSQGVDTVAVCESFTWINGKTYTSSNTTAKDTIVNVGGCDSIVTLHLTILEPTSKTLELTECDAFVSPTGKVWTTTGFFRDTLANSKGCDSTISYGLTIIESDEIISKDPKDLLVNTADDASFSIELSTGLTHTYQWQENNGNGFQNLSNIGPYSGTLSKMMKITNVSSTYHKNQYRCIATTNDCSDTSDVGVLTIKGTGSAVQLGKLIYSIYPNPAKNKLNFKNDASLVGEVYTIYSILGNEISAGKLTSQSIINIEHLSDGVYFLSLGEEAKQFYRFIKSSRY